ncbi:MAG: hypothetical protein PHT83_03640, partial [Bacilli bacterium]|nr:hypothetical protein [Bacilli bacterium]
MKKILSICLLLFMVLINLSFVNALPAEISMVFASPGENASTEINISWHATIASSTLVYTTKDDTSYANG